MTIRSAACQVYKTISFQLANLLVHESVSLLSYFSATTLDDSGHNQGGMLSTYWATHVVSAGTHPGMPIIVMCTTREDDVSPRWQYASRDVNNNSINSAHGHQPKGMMVLWRRYSLGRTQHSRAILGV